MAGNLEQQLTELVKPLIESVGLSLWGLRYRSNAEHASLQIYVDSQEGVSADQCGDVVDILSPALDSADLIVPAYTLEVSSPGLDRLFFTTLQAKDYIGCEVKAELRMPVEGRRKLTGVLVNVADDGMLIIREHEDYAVAFANISQLRLVPVFPKKGSKSPHNAS